MSRQHKTPYVISDGRAHMLQPATGLFFAEDRLQEFIFQHHQALPIDEIEPAFEPLIPVCSRIAHEGRPHRSAIHQPHRSVDVGAKCKLWKNPEARREVVGQILDYATEISRWSYEDLGEY